MGPTRGDRPLDARRGIAAVAAITAVAAILGVVPATAEPDPPEPVTAAVTVGPNPAWIVGDETITSRTRAATDAEGWTYITSNDVLASIWAPNGRLEVQAVIEGTGSISGVASHLPPDVAVDPVGEAAIVTGWVTGSVMFSGTNGSKALNGGTGASFYAEVTRDGRVEVARLFGGGTARASHVGFVDDTIVIAGELSGPTTIDSLPATTAGNGDAFVVGFGRASEEAEWITQLAVAPRHSPFEDVDFRDLDGDGDSVALVAHTANGLTVSGDGQSLARPCPSGGYCHVIIDLDAATGRPLLAAVASDTGDLDEVYTTEVQIVDDGYVTLGEDRNLPAPAALENAFVARFDAQGAPQWSRYLYGSESLEAGADLAVDANGDIHVGVTFPDQTTLGDGPGAPVLTDPEGGELLVEYASDGTLKRYVQGSGDFAPSNLDVDSTDALRVVSDRYGPGPISFGTGPAVTGTGPVIASFGADVAALAEFQPTVPLRVLDSRTETGGWNQKLTSNAPMTLSFGSEPEPAGATTNNSNHPVVPYDTTAVVLNLTVTDVSEMTYVTAWPTGSARPVASSINAVAGDTISNQVTVRLGDLQGIQIATARGSVNVVADLLGYYTVGSGYGYHSMTPTRLLDSRTATGGWGSSKLNSTAPRELVVGGANGIPNDAAAVVLSVTATDTSNQTYLRVEPTGFSSSSSNLNVDRGETITNLVTTRIGTDRRIRFTNNTGTVNVVVDAVGYYDFTGASFRAIDPARVLDSRFGTGGYNTPWSAGTTRTIPVSQVATGDDLVAVATNLTATDTTQMSLLTLFPAAPRPGTSNLLFTPGQTIAAAANTGVAPNGTVSLYNQLGSAHLVLDVNGYFTTP